MGSGWAGRRLFAAGMAAGMMLAGCGGGANEGPGAAGSAATGAGATSGSTAAIGGTAPGTIEGAAGTGLQTASGPVPGSGRAMLGASGGNVELRGIGDVKFAPSVLAAATLIELSQTRSEAVASSFEHGGPLYDVTARTPYEMHVLLGSAQPLGEVEVRLVIPPELRAQATMQDEVRLFYLNVDENENHRHEVVEATVERGAPGDASLTARVPREAFQPRADGRHEGWFFLALTPTAQPKASASAASMQPEAQGAATPSGDAAQGQASADGPSGKMGMYGDCAGSVLRLPVDARFKLSSRYGPRPKPKSGGSTFHLGLDFPTPIGTPVHAAADGVVRVLREGDGKGGFKGWGVYIVLDHEGSGKTLYAHLKEDGIAVRNGATVTAGQLIAHSGDTGVGPAHFHFEYMPSGLHTTSGNRVDPEPCLDAMPGGDLAVRDNGSLYDDTFSVALDGRHFCRTRSGEANACSLGALRAGTYRLSITVVDAPDGKGTFEVAAQNPRVRIDGQMIVAGTAAVGERRDYVLVVGR